jgi:hypothetical protein
MPDRLNDLANLLVPHLPAGFGALLGLRWARGLTPLQKLTGFGTSFGLAVYFGPAVAELLALGPKSTIAVGILIAVIGGDIVGGLIAAARAFSADPVGTFKTWWNAWRGQS